MEGWRAWLAQAAKLQTYIANEENPRKDWKWFYKMDENSISIIREELIEDFYSLDQIRLKEIKKLHENFEDDQIQFAIKLETYEKEHVQSQEE